MVTFALFFIATRTTHIKTVNALCNFTSNYELSRRVRADTVTDVRQPSPHVSDGVMMSFLTFRAS
jgi:hypothetical protein